ncbi:hypothetical protein K1719_032262 [Acacia pycnantha]|nr:hypothetical protein K1719_032262 [Acacia pycnantha]
MRPLELMYSTARIRSEVLSPREQANNAQLSRLSREESLSNLKLRVDDKKIIPVTTKRKRLWQLAPIYISEWFEYLNEQKKLAGVSSEYLSLRLDGRVRGSGVGYPPWNALVAQLPPAKGIWSGLLDGMDGRIFRGGSV